MNEYTQIFLEGYGDDVYTPITEGFLQTVWDKIVKAFKALYKAIKDAFDRIKKYASELRKKIMESDEERARNKVMNKEYYYEQDYSVKDLAKTIDGNLNFMNDLAPTVVQLFKAGKNPESFDVDGFTKKAISMLNKHNVGDISYENKDTSDGIKFTTYARIDKDPKSVKFTFKDIDNILNMVELYNKKLSSMSETVKNLTGNIVITGLPSPENDGYKPNEKFISHTAIRMSNALTMLGDNNTKCVELMLKEVELMRKATGTAK